jgi:hypothetical protein
MSKKNDEEKTEVATPARRVFLWMNAPIRKRRLVIEGAEDRPHLHGIAAGKPGKYIDIIYGVYDTTDKDKIETLTSHDSYNKPGSDGFRDATSQEREHIDTMMNNGVPRKVIVKNLIELKDKFRLLGADPEKAVNAIGAD